MSVNKAYPIFAVVFAASQLLTCVRCQPPPTNQSYQLQMTGVNLTWAITGALQSQAIKQTVVILDYAQNTLGAMTNNFMTLVNMLNQTLAQCGLNMTSIAGTMVLKNGQSIYMDYPTFMLQLASIQNLQNAAGAISNTLTVMWMNGQQQFDLVQWFSNPSNYLTANLMNAQINGQSVQSATQNLAAFQQSICNTLQALNNLFNQFSQATGFNPNSPNTAVSYQAFFLLYTNGFFNITTQLAQNFYNAYQQSFGCGNITNANIFSQSFAYSIAVNNAAAQAMITAQSYQQSSPPPYNASIALQPLMQLIWLNTTMGYNSRLAVAQYNNNMTVPTTGMLAAWTLVSGAPQILWQQLQQQASTAAASYGSVVSMDVNAFFIQVQQFLYATILATTPVPMHSACLRPLAFFVTFAIALITWRATGR